MITATLNKLSNRWLIAAGTMVAVLSQLSACDTKNNSENTVLAPSVELVKPAVATLANRSLTEPLLTARDLPAYLTRDIQDEVFYFVMPDRFHNGNVENDQGSKTLTISAGGFDRKNKGMYHGGDLIGLQQKLPYLKSLGISAIWLTPILRNQAVQADGAGYHGYWVLDFTEIDPHLGSNDDLKALIDAAHQENIKVFFDIITNHTADVIKYEQCHGTDGLQWLIKDESGCPYKSLAQLASGDSYKTVIPQGQEHLKTPAWLNEAKYYHNQGDSSFEGENSLYGDFAGLDDLNTDDPAVVAGMIDIFKNIIAQFKPDGFRIDTVKHVNTEFWSEFSPALVDYANSLGLPKFFMFGEVYSGDSKELSKYTTVGKMQSVLDFGFQFTLQDTLIKQQGTDKLAELFARDIDYLDHDSNANQLLTFTGNHDMGRFAAMLKSSTFNYDEHEQIQRNLLANAMMYFLRGIPIIYYGDEQGFVGDGGDKDSRQDMMPSLVTSYNDDDLLATNATTADDNFDPQHPFYQVMAEYAHIYHKYPALRYGVQKTLYSQNSVGIFALARTMADNSSEQLVIINTANSAQTTTFEVSAAQYEVSYQGAGDNHHISVTKDQTNRHHVTVTVPALSFAIYQRQ